MVILYSDFIKTSKINTGPEGLVFLGHKNEPASTREEDGQIIPATNDSPMYFFILLISSPDMLCKQLEVSGAPRRRSVAQS